MDLRKGKISGAISYTFNRIDEESKDIDKLGLAAEMGRWDVVWYILARKSYLINCIPANRRYGLLHKAVCCRSVHIVRSLLLYPGCDPNIRAKECITECGPMGGKTPLQMAQAYGYHNIVDILLNTKDTSNVCVESSMFAPCDTVIEDRGIIAITLAVSKAQFHPDPINKRRSVTNVLKYVFKKINESSTLWRTTRIHVCDTLYAVNQAASKKIKCSSTTRELFYSAIISRCSNEDTRLYYSVNATLRHQTEKNYHPSAYDLALGPYIVMYKMLFLYWDRLPNESRTTYRRVLLSDEHIDMYQPGLHFTWLGFVSCSVKIPPAISFQTDDCVVLFIIDNTTPCAWQPRNIAKFAQNVELECVYPAGARFRVTGRTMQDNMTVLKLKLIY